MTTPVRSFLFVAPTARSSPASAVRRVRCRGEQSAEMHLRIGDATAIRLERRGADAR